MARDKSLSPTGSGGDATEGLQTSTTGAQARPELSLKRGRAESVEPTQLSESPAATTTAVKKNRLAPSTGKAPAGPMDPSSSPNLDHKAKPGAVVEDPRSIAEETEADVAGESPVKGKGETRNVGEVRKKVEKMTHDEAQAAAQKEIEGNEGVELELPPKEDDQPDSAMSISTRANSPGPATNIDQTNTDTEDTKTTSEEGKDGLKRKALDRSQSSYIENDVDTKRQKDEIEATTEMKPLDPAEADKVAKSTDTTPATAPAPAKKPQSTFASFSSSASPFATSSTSAFGSAASSSSTPAKPANAFAKSGFGGFSSASSPFARAKTSTSEASKEEEKGDKAGPSSFGDILARDQGADEDSAASKLQMTEQDVHTGEEEEETVYQTRSKLYVMEKDGGWRERGVGMFKVNVRRSDGKGARLVMRAEGVLRLILNVSLFVGQTVLEDGKHVRMTVFEDGERRSVTFRTGSAKVAHEMYQAIHDHIPVESSTPARSADPEAALSGQKDDAAENV